MTTTITTDARSRVVLPGGSNRQYIVETFEDGSMFLQPAVTVARAQLEYNSDPELRKLLTEAAGSATVTRTRARRDR